LRCMNFDIKSALKS